MLNPNLTANWMRCALIGTVLGLFGLPSIGMAQDFLDPFSQNLFGGGQIQNPQPEVRTVHRRRSVRVRHKHHPRRVSAFAAAAPISASAHCVRLCDGRHFPLAGSTTEETSALCVAACPDAKTKVFFGDSAMKDAVDSDGRQYGDLPNAFAYQRRVVAGCSCKDGRLGLATIDIEKDPTLQHGDIVTTQQGAIIFRGRNQQQATFILAKNRSDIAPDIRRYLSTLRMKDGR